VSRKGIAIVSRINISFIIGLALLPVAVFGAVRKNVVLVVVDKSVYPRVQLGLDRYIADVKRDFDVEFRPVVADLYAMSPPQIRAVLKDEWKRGRAGVRGAIMVGPIPCARAWQHGDRNSGARCTTRTSTPCGPMRTAMASSMD